MNEQLLKQAQDIIKYAIDTFHVEYDAEAMEFYGKNFANDVTYWGAEVADVDAQFSQWRRAVVDNVKRQGDEGCQMLIAEFDNVHAEAVGLERA